MNCWTPFKLIGGGNSKIDLISLKFIEIPFLDTTLPRITPCPTPNCHFSGLSEILYNLHRLKSNRKDLRCSSHWEYIHKSSRKISSQICKYSLKAVLMSLWKFNGVLVKSNGILRYPYTPQVVAKAVLCWSLGLMDTWLYPENPSKKLYASWPNTLLSTCSINGKG